MSTSESSNGNQSHRAHIPRWTAPILWTVGIGVVHVLGPWLISLLSTRYGWVDGRPGLWNWPGLILAAAGLACVIWCAGLHFVSSADGWVWELAPGYMLIRGPYKYSRNPMYVLEVIMLLGWALFYGSIPVVIATLLMAAVFALKLVPDEEQAMEARFGESYRQYKNSVPRWIGKSQR